MRLLLFFVVALSALASEALPAGDRAPAEIKIPNPKKLWDYFKALESTSKETEKAVFGNKVLSEAYDLADSGAITQDTFKLLESLALWLITDGFNKNLKTIEGVAGVKIDKDNLFDKYREQKLAPYIPKEECILFFTNGVSYAWNGKEWVRHPSK
ncbi:MAG: hypothetical protein JWL59_4840 [Chthoniobacteraceae bacterium]|nr:hypothetical protein [Chthoniobacteraceae bacterium]